MSNKTQILIVDDERIHRVLLSELLEDFYDISIAKNGKQALQCIENNPDIDLVLLDIIMPEMDGYETCIRLKNKPGIPDIPVIFLSARNEMADKVKAFSLGGVDYITKPFQQEEVMARVRTHLALLTAQRSLWRKNAALEHEIVQRKKAETEQERLITELKKALSEIKQLSGLLPICVFCKKIRDDNDYWFQLEEYISVRSEVEFSHGLCPACMKKHYPEFDLDDTE